MKVEANGIYTNYRIRGKGDNFVLIHGGADNLNMWYPQVSSFSQNYRVITYDIRGFGKTENPGGEYSMPVLVNDLFSLLEVLKIRNAHLLGYSIGGRIALELSINYPEMVKSLVLVNSHIGLIQLPDEEINRQKKMVGLLYRGDIKSVAQMLVETSFSPDFRDTHSADYYRYLRIKSQTKPEGLITLLKSLKGSGTPNLSKIKCPTLLVLGERDVYMGMAQGIPVHNQIIGSELVILPAGHCVSIELAEQFNKIVLDFLLKIDGP